MKHSGAQKPSVKGEFSLKSTELIQNFFIGANMNTAKSRLTLTFLFYALLALMWFLFAPVDTSAQSHRILFYDNSSFQNLLTSKSTAPRSITPRLQKIPPFRLSFRARGIGRVTLTFSTKWNKRWVATSGSLLHARKDSKGVHLLRGKATVLNSKKQKRRKLPLAAVIYDSHDGAYTFRATLRSPRRKSSYELLASLPSSTSRIPRVEVRRIPHSSLQEATCSALGHNPHPDHNHLAPSPHQRLEGDVLVELTTIADGDFTALYGADTNAVIAGIVNTTNVFYHNELGLELEIIGQHSFDDSSDPYSSTTDPEDLLDDFTYIHPPSDTFGTSDLFHLFTGRDLNSGVIGIAWVGHVCDPFQNTAISQHVDNEASRAVLLAHEIGHNFGAHHDQPIDGYEHIMRPVINPDANTFSLRSKHDIAEHVSTRSCIDGGGASGTPTPTPTPPPTPSPSPTPEVTPSPTPTPLPTDPPSVLPTPSPLPIPTTPEELRSLLEESSFLLQQWKGASVSIEISSTITLVLEQHRAFLSTALESPWFSPRQKKRIRRAEKALSKLLSKKQKGKKFKKRLKRARQKTRRALRLFVF